MLSVAPKLTGAGLNGGSGAFWLWLEELRGSLPCLGGGETSWCPKAAFLRVPAADKSQSQHQGQLH